MHSDLQTAADYLAAHDPILATVIAAAPLPDLAPHTDYYRTLVSSIIGQQLSVKAAAAIRKKFTALFNDKFPLPEQILDADFDAMRAAGLSRQKIAYIRDLAEHILAGTVNFDTMDALTNEQIAAELLPVKGIGEWTVHMFLLFCMGRRDVLPTGDLGVRTGIQKLYGLPSLPTADEVKAIATKNNWHPYESIASWYIWHSLDNAPK